MLTTVVTKDKRHRMPIGPICLSKIAARTCRDLNPLFFRHAALIGLLSTPFWFKLSSFIPGAETSLEEFGLEDLLWCRDCMYARVPPASRAPDTSATVLLFIQQVCNSLINDIFKGKRKILNSIACMIQGSLNNMAKEYEQKYHKWCSPKEKQVGKCS